MRLRSRRPGPARFPGPAGGAGIAAFPQPRALAGRAGVRSERGPPRPRGRPGRLGVSPRSAPGRRPGRVWPPIGPAPWRIGPVSRPGRIDQGGRGRRGKGREAEPAPCNRSGRGGRHGPRPGASRPTARAEGRKHRAGSPSRAARSLGGRPQDRAGGAGIAAPVPAPRLRVRVPLSGGKVIRYESVPRGARPAGAGPPRPLRALPGLGRAIGRAVGPGAGTPPPDRGKEGTGGCATHDRPPHRVRGV